MIKLIFSILIILNLIYNINGQTQECAAALAPWFETSDRIGIVLTCINGDGVVEYARGQSLRDRSVLKATGPYYAVDSNREACDNGLEQPFDIARTKVLFFDSTSFVIGPTGLVTLSIAGVGGYTFYLSSCKSNIMVGTAEGRLFAFHFSTNKYTGLGTDSCSRNVTTPPSSSSSSSTPPKTVTFSTTITNQWEEGGVKYGMFKTDVKNTNLTPITILVVTSDFELRHPDNIWNMVTIVKGQYSLPSYITSIAPNAIHTFSFIKIGYDIPTFNVQTIY